MPASRPSSKYVALKEMESDRALPGMLSHHSIKEIMILRRLNHQNIASAQNVHYSHNLCDRSLFDLSKKNFKMYIEMEKARHDLQELTKHKETRVHLRPP